MPVELVPSWEFWNKSNFTATLVGMPGVPPGKPAPYPKPPPEGPSAVAPAFWMVKVIPSELALMNWKVKSLVKVCTLIGVVNQALLASPCPPSVNCKRVPFSLVRPLNCKPVAENPEAKLMLGEPPL